MGKTTQLVVIPQYDVISNHNSFIIDNKTMITCINNNVTLYNAYIINKIFIICTYIEIICKQFMCPQTYVYKKCRKQIKENVNLY